MNKALAVVMFVFLLLIKECTIKVPSVEAAINPQINFQGKLTKPDGTNVADGPYSIDFSIYTASSGGSAVWTETQPAVDVSDGIFQVNLGSVAALPGSVDFDSAPLYLGIKVGADAEMTPRILLSAAPYAFDSDELGGIGASGFIQLGPSAAQTDATTNASIFVNKTGASGNILELQKTGSDILTVAGSGQIQASSGAYQSNFVTINNGNSGATPAIPGSYLPTLTVRTEETSGSRPLFFGYDNGAGGWAAYLDSGTCGAFTQMCLDLGSGSTSFTAMENVGTTLDVGGGDDGNFADVNFLNSGTATFNSSVTHNLTGSQQITVAASSAPTVDQFLVTNAGQPVTTNDVNGEHVDYAGGAAAVQGAGIRVDYTPGSASGGTWSGMRIVEDTAAASGVVSYGLKLEGGGTGAGKSSGVEVASGWDIGVDIQSGGLQLAAQADPSVPAANNLRIYAESIAGRVMPKWLGPSGVDTPFQASLGFNRVAWTNPSGGGTLTTCIVSMGSAFTNAGTCANPTPASTNLLASTRSTTFATANAAGSLASHRQSTLQVWRGNVAGYGGFFYTIRFGTDALNGGERAFVGLSDSIAAPTNVDPTTSAAIGKVGVAINTNTGNWNLVTNTAGTAPTKTSLAGIPVKTTDLYELVLFSAPDGTSIGYRVTDLSTNGQVTGTIAANMPANTDFLAPQFWVTNNTTTGRPDIDFNGWYLESDN